MSDLPAEAPKRDDPRTEVLGEGRFRNMLIAIARQSVLTDLTALTPNLSGTGSVTDPSREEIDWGFALLCASALTSTPVREAQDAALRVATACLNSQIDLTLREAATVILERLGNRPSLSLAAGRGLVEPDAWTDAPLPLQLDVIRRRLELTIPTSTGTAVAANQFQRDFWTAASTFTWLSVSAPTSAGKSYIVKRWLEDRAGTGKTFRAVYLVPTRALIEEVSLDLVSELDDGVRVHTMPWASSIGDTGHEIFVLTQERLHLLQQRFRDFRPDLVFVDEAQKFDDGSRGVLLQQVLDENARRAPTAQVIFASPFTSNPEILLEGAPAHASLHALQSHTVTVAQNLLFATQVPRRPLQWTVDLIWDGEAVPCGAFTLPARPHPRSKRLPLVAVALGGTTTGNVVYVNGAADAETAAKQIYEALGPESDLDDEEITELRELARTSVHPRYGLDEVLRRGVAFHYGNMPLLLKSEIERLFRGEKIRYLVCTSTLLEGVNLPCRNLFVRGPRRGRGNVMTPGDFWNLAGRSGRWGKEFQGNIVCVDTDDQAQWPNPPQRRESQTIHRASDRILGDLPQLVQYIEDSTPVASGRNDNVVEQVYSLLASRVARGDDLTTLVGFPLDTDEARSLEASVQASIQGLAVPIGLIERHAGISPMSMQRLLDSFQGRDAESLVLPLPESSDALSAYSRAIALVNEHLGGNWGVQARQTQLAMLIINWMRGLPLARIIASRIAFEATRGQENTPKFIRDTMTDVEQIARFQAPKYLACYQDLLRFYATSLGGPLPQRLDLDVSMMLELGVSRVTEVSLMSLGLSRTTTTALAELIIQDDMTPAEAQRWLKEQTLDALDLPSLVRREIRNALNRPGTAEIA